MFELIKCEWIKLCRKRITIISTLVCFAGTCVLFLLPYLQYEVWDEDANRLFGREAVNYRKEIYEEKLSGILTEERIYNDIVEYQTMYHNPDNTMEERGGEVTFKDEIYYRYFEPRRSYLRWLGNSYSNNEVGTLNLINLEDEQMEDFYTARRETIVERIQNNETLSESEKEYWKDKSLSVPTPFEYGYVLGWSQFGTAAQMLIICILGICIAVAPVFSEEYRLGTDAVILSTKYGKSKLIVAKLVTAFAFATVVYAVNAIAAITIPLLCFGPGGGNLPIQIALSLSPYRLTFFRVTMLSVLLAYLVLLGMVSLALFLSSRVKSSIAVISVLVFMLFIPMFLPFARITALFPSNAVLGQVLYGYYISYRLGSVVINHFQMIFILYMICTCSCLPMAYRAFRRHQI